MPEIKCPNCGEVFKIDESNYASIVKQIRDHEFNDELKQKETQFQKELNNAIELTKTKVSADSLTKINDLELEIVKLKAELTNKDSELSNKVNQAIASKDKEVLELKNELSLADSKAKLNEQSLINKYEDNIKGLNEQLQFYKDFKAKQSTKMIGESLEQHCLNEFNRLRPTAFKNAYFEKDNDASLGSKGDFIFRDYDDEKTEFISIMFEMKNEADETATKHKNEDFFAKLDKDRKEKNCEYAVLVSLLEADNEYYNDGIVDVCHKYPKMYVVRPQFFIPIITLLRNAALNSLAYKKELVEIRNQDIDVTNFENNMNAFKESFARNYDLASKKFQDAIDEIDKSIDHLQKIKQALTGSDNNLRLANNKAQELSIKKLTKNAPSVAEKFNNNK